ncbi:hypothetical protein [Azoarcus sp. DN11]|uniref:hypothetical protein n=1 Tax=Azoarcus sp. DN11 TaxID=356837 RepID=UPI000EB36D59|nr:hypothetical protein [Azoarcus sp. DN11]AYH46116.1 hypothetical protein CDA09_22520 [Azoarcus sp. DN11]
MMIAQVSTQQRSALAVARLARTSLAGLALAGAAIAPVVAMDVTSNISVPGTLQLSVTGDCSNTGPVITLGPTITLHDVPVTVLFDGGGAHDATVHNQVDLHLTLADGPIVLPKQGAAPNGVTGNPQISVYVNGNLIMGPVRCNKL